MVWYEWATGTLWFSLRPESRCPCCQKNGRGGKVGVFFSNSSHMTSHPGPQLVSHPRVDQSFGSQTQLASGGEYTAKSSLPSLILLFLQHCGHLANVHLLLVLLPLSEWRAMRAGPARLSPFLVNMKILNE